MSTLRAMAGVFAAEGYRRCLHVQTASVVDFGLVTEALGEVSMSGVLLSASEETRVTRLSGREIGSDLDRHLASTAAWPTTSNAPLKGGSSESRQLTGRCARSRVR